MKKTVTTYDEVGRLIVITSIDDEVRIPRHPDGTEWRYVDGSWDQHKYYVISGIALERPDNPTQLVGTTLFNIPLPAQIRIGETLYDCTDSTVELHFPPGTYGVTVQTFPHKPASFTVVSP
jgi:hypothetical protein